MSCEFFPGSKQMWNPEELQNRITNTMSAINNTVGNITNVTADKLALYHIANSKIHSILYAQGFSIIGLTWLRHVVLEEALPPHSKYIWNQATWYQTFHYIILLARNFGNIKKTNDTLLESEYFLLATSNLMSYSLYAMAILNRKRKYHSLLSFERKPLDLVLTGSFLLGSTLTAAWWIKQVLSFVF